MSGITKWAAADGSFKRQVSSFRDFVSKTSPKFKPAAGRYHLYVSYACPWSEGIAKRHWSFGRGLFYGRECTPEETPGCIPDPHHNSKFIRELYLRADPSYSARFTVPVLWDTETQTIVNNESSEIIRMLSAEFNDFAENPELELYPEELKDKIDETNEWLRVLCPVPNTTNALDEESAKKVFEGLKKVDSILENNKYLVPGDRLTEADIRLYTTILRFDPVYFGHFKCNLLAVSDCPNIMRWLKMISNLPGVRETINMEHIKVPISILLEYSRNTTTCPTSKSIPPRLSPFLKAPSCLTDAHLSYNEYGSKLALVVPFIADELPTIERNFAVWAKHSPCTTNLPVDLVFYFNSDYARHPHILPRLRALSVPSCFRRTQYLMANLPQAEDTYPLGASLMFFKAMEIPSLVDGYRYMYWMEADQQPCRTGWLDALYRTAINHPGFWMIGSIVRDGQASTTYYSFADHLNGNALYRLDDPQFHTFLARVQEEFSKNKGRFLSAFDIAIYLVARHTLSFNEYARTKHRFQYSDLMQNMYRTAANITTICDANPSTYFVHGKYLSQ
ncbi:Glutathione S-transferase omega-like 2 [Paramicrosporidium saccamoebae]|uniref:Glutathione S-transferase omega-like 2 n=1 Tax=Paramicrosporidium saccamoebae TaxID=1246581 RepID=A0A2H9TQR6_9FUNG|nr:Glutathione S-transferase omega-like 2 [Paramicrosporidium saccamoebae]